MGFDVIYTKGLKGAIDRFGVWKPGTSIKLGDIGIFKGKQFHRCANIADAFGIAFKENHSPKSKNGATISIGKNKRTTVYLGGKATESHNAEIKIDLSIDGEKAIYVDSIGSQIHCIDDLIALQRDVLKLENKWDKKWSIITEIEIVDSATIIISNSKDSSVVFGASAKVDIEDVNLAELNSGLKVIRESEAMYNITVDYPSALSFKAHKLKKDLFGGLFSGSSGVVMNFAYTRLQKKLEGKDTYALEEITEDDF